MPNRIIRESCTTSPTLDALSDGAERMFWRLTTVVDDFGRFDADNRVLLAKCFPLKVGILKIREINKYKDELINNNLIKLYRVGEKCYGFFVSWEKYQNIRARVSKFPSPPP